MQPQGRSSTRVTSMTHLSSILRAAVSRLTDVPHWTRSRAGGPARRAPIAKPHSIPPPEHETRLETMFEALSDLSFQPHVAAALELACDALQGELPTEAVAAGLYDIDADEIRFVVARGERRASLGGAAMPRARCLTGYATEGPIIIRGGRDAVDWIGSGEDGSTVLLCPILHDGNLLGVIALADPLCSATFARHDTDLVRYVAEQLASFIHAQRQKTRSARKS